MKTIDLKPGDRVIVATALDPHYPERRGVVTALYPYGRVTVRLDGESMDRETSRSRCSKEA